VYYGLVIFFAGKGYHAVNHCEDGVVFADAHAITWVELSATLANDDVAGNSALSTKNFHAQAFAMRFASVPRTTGAFLVSHAVVFL
jgi:hypothetical protein